MELTGHCKPEPGETYIPKGAASSADRTIDKSTGVSISDLPALEQAYNIERIVGKGGMGYVAIGTSITTGGNRVAIKFSISQEPYHQDRFNAEINNSAALQDIPQLGAATGSFRTTREHTVFSKETTIRIPADCRCFTTVYYEASTLQEMINFYHRLRRGDSIESLTAPPVELREWLDASGKKLSAKFDTYCATLGDLEEKKFRVKVEDQFESFRRASLFPLEYFGLDEFAKITPKQLQAMEARLIETVADTARLVHAMHEKEIIHRDLKPENILVNATSRIPLLIDFGLSRFIVSDQDRQLDESSRLANLASPGSTSKLTQAGTIMGTLAYMPPEQTAANESLVSKGIDVYSIGAILYYIYCGKKQIVEPRSTQDIMRCVKQICDGDIPAPTPISSTPERFRILESIIRRAMGRDSGARHRSMLELTRELDAWRENQLVHSYIESPGNSVAAKLSYRAFLWMAAHPRITTMAASFGAIMAGWVGVEWGAHGARSSAEIKAREALVSMDRSDTDSLVKAREVLLSADGDLAPFRYTFGDYLTGASLRNESLREQVDSRLAAHQFLHVAYDTIASTSNDYATFTKKADSNIQALSGALAQYVPGYDQPGVAAHYRDELTRSPLSHEERLSCRYAASHLLLNLALRLPHNPYLGLKNKSDAEKILVYLQNAREIGAEEVFGDRLTLAELFLERRARAVMRDNTRLAEIDAAIEQTEPRSGLDYFLRAKFLLDVRRNASAANSILKEGIDREDAARISYLRSGDRERANLSRGIIGNLSAVRMAALRSLRNFTELGRESSRFMELAKTYDDPQVSDFTMGRALAYEAVNIWYEHSQPNAPFNPEQAREFRRLVSQSILISPNPIVYNNWASFERNTGNLEEAIRVCRDGLEHFPDSESLTSRLATLQAGTGDIRGAYNSIVKILNFTSATSGVSLPLDHLRGGASGLREIFELNGGILDQMDLYSLSDVIKTLSLSAGRPESGAEAPIYGECAFLALNHFIARCEAEGGYGKDLLILTHKTFEPLMAQNPDAFAATLARFGKLPDTLQYTKYE